MPSLGVQLQPCPERGSCPLGHPGSSSLSPSGWEPGRPGLLLPFCLNIRAGLPVSLQLPLLQDLHAGGQSELGQPRGGGCAPACCPQGSAPPRPMTSCAHVWPIFCFKLSTVGCVSFLQECFLPLCHWGVFSLSFPLSPPGLFQLSFPVSFSVHPSKCLLFLTGF